MKKVLFVATVDVHIRSFHLPYLNWFQEQGYEVHVATGEQGEISYCDVKHTVLIQRSPFKLENLKGIKQLRQIIKKEKFDIIHCHTPMGGVATRLAARGVRKSGTRVIYTAHGFHFYKGASVLNWMVYYPIEWLCAWLTDTLITITTEDYNLAKKHMHAKCVEYVPGVGVDLDKYSTLEVNRDKKRDTIGIPRDAFLILSVGELNQNKNHKVVIEAMGELQDHTIHYCIAGDGDQREDLLERVRELGLEKQVHLLGYRNDVGELYKTSDLFCFPSYREGLSLALMEAMACDLDCVVSDIRGNKDLIKDVAFRFHPKQTTQLSSAIKHIKNNQKKDRSTETKKEIKQFSLENVMNRMMKIYKKGER